MDGCDSYREIDVNEYNIDVTRVWTVGGNWGVIITSEGKVRIPVYSYDDIMPLICKKTR